MWYHVSARSTIQAKYVQSQVARATANCLTFAGRAQNGKDVDRIARYLCFVFQPTGLQYLSDIPRRFLWLPTSTICLILLFVNPLPSGKCRKLKVSYSVVYALALFATVGFLTWSILLTQFTQACLCAKQKHVQWERYQGTIGTIRLSDQQCTALFSSKNAKLQILRCQLFEKNMVRWAKNPFHIREAIGKR